MNNNKVMTEKDYYYIRFTMVNNNDRSKEERRE